MIGLEPTTYALPKAYRAFSDFFTLIVFIEIQAKTYYYLFKLNVIYSALSALIVP